MDYAIIEIGGTQHRVSQGDTIRVERIPAAKAGKKGSLALDRVLLVKVGEAYKVGSPLVEGASVKATVVDEFKGKKVLVFKKKRRKQYRRTKGHRQQGTRLRIEEIRAGD